MKKGLLVTILILTMALTACGEEPVNTGLEPEGVEHILEENVIEETWESENVTRW